MVTIISPNVEAEEKERFPGGSVDKTNDQKKVLLFFYLSPFYIISFLSFVISLILILDASRKKRKGKRKRKKTKRKA